jgi:alpha-tubulin suppressor-like RCC1 family protein
MMDFHIVGDQISLIFKKINKKIKTKIKLKIKSYCQIGDGTSGANILFPVAVKLNNLQGKRILQISSGGWHSCVIGNDYNSYCWGRNEYLFLNFKKYLLLKQIIFISHKSFGQIGDGTSGTNNILIPVAVNNSGVLLEKSILQISYFIL